MTRARYYGWEGSPTSEKVQRILEENFELVEEDYEYIFSFGPKILTKEELAKAKYAINFHTGPPRWPGRKSAERALCAGDQMFGVTAHLMEPEVDAGLIIDVVEFDIPRGISALGLKEMAFEKIPILVDRVARINRWRCKAYKAADPIEAEV